MRMEFCKIVIIAFLLSSTNIINSVQCRQNEKAVISTRHGDIEGLIRHFPDINQPIKSVNKFLGIPYAAPPTGELRFQPPQQHAGWKPNTYNATYFRSICIQDPRYNEYFWPAFSLPQSEDCLYLNVYAPRASNTSNEDQKKKHYPVMVYIHGGGYEVGTPAITPGDVLPLWGIVLVTIQYRLGPFGFVTTGDSTAPGNYGILDQVKALTWIKENIRNFGGDPSLVTIYGESAGGSSVGLLVLSPHSKGLFQRAIALSGIDFSPFATGNKTIAVLHTKDIASSLKCPTEESSQIIDCLRSKKASNIPLGSNIWRPVVDGDVLPDTPENMRKNGTFNEVDLMAGFTSQEGAYFFPTQIRNVTPETFRKEVRFVMTYIHNRYGQTLKVKATLPGNVLDALVFMYTPWPYESDVYKVKRGFADMVTDSCVAAPTHSVLTSHSEQSSAVYLYEFAHRSQLNPDASWLGVRHKDDTPYEFGFPLMNLTVLQQYDDVDRNVSEMVITLFTNFAKYGNPTPHPVHGASWDTFNSSHRRYLRIQAQPEMALNFQPTRMAFWDKYYAKLPQQHDCPGTAMSARGTVTNYLCNTAFVYIPILTMFVFM